MKILAVIPARAGSKGVPNKNIRKVNNKPLIAHTIDTAIKSGAFSKILVTTDCDQIKGIAINAGADVPFLRGSSLSSDTALAVPVIKDATEKAISHYKIDFDAVCMLQPTSPLRSQADCNNVCNKLVQDNEVSSVISVVEVSQHPYKMVRRSSDGIMLPFLDWPVENPPRQSLPPVYVFNGAFYLTRTKVLLKESTFKGNKTYLYEMPSSRSVNIDTEIDLKIADMLMT